MGVERALGGAGRPKGDALGSRASVRSRAWSLSAPQTQSRASWLLEEGWGSPTEGHHRPGAEVTQK